MTQTITPKRSTFQREIPVPPEPARDRLLKAATALFFRYGINATGVDAIVEAAGTAKATLYKLFGSKEALVEAVLEAEGQTWRTKFFKQLDSHSGTPREKLMAIFDILKEWFAGESFFGCPFANAVGEFDKRSEHYKRLAQAHKRLVVDYITRMAEAAQLKDAAGVAAQLMMLMEGAIATALVSGDPTAAQTARVAAAKILAAK
jgi:AcrR family transcriptional regulator